MPFGGIVGLKGRCRVLLTCLSVTARSIGSLCASAHAVPVGMTSCLDYLEREAALVERQGRRGGGPS